MNFALGGSESTQQYAERVEHIIQQCQDTAMMPPPASDDDGTYAAWIDEDFAGASGTLKKALDSLASPDLDEHLM